jgi:hypothetical protein
MGILKTILGSTTSPNQRSRLLEHVTWLPDTLMLRFQYFVKLGRLPNLKNPTRFTEKIQWYKLYYRNPQLPRVIDKLEVRKYVTELGREDLLKDLYAVFDSAEQFSLNKLPSSFALKSTNGGGSRNVILVADKSAHDENDLADSIRPWFAGRRKSAGREWAYSKVRPRVFAEELIPHLGRFGLREYQFFCFSGKPHYLFVLEGSPGASSIRKGFFDMAGRHVDIGNSKYDFALKKGESGIIDLPDNFDEMTRTAEQLARPFPFMRVDLYSLEGRMLLGEMTFYNGSGYVDYRDFDFTLGQLLPPVAPF